MLKYLQEEIFLEDASLLHLNLLNAPFSLLLQPWSITAFMSEVGAVKERVISNKSLLSIFPPILFI